jgi:DUF971 family protein
MVSSPLQIRAIRAEKLFEIVWDANTCRRYPFRFLRGECPCAGCVNEFTGERILDLATVSEDVHPVGLEFSGNYALKIQWSDGHSTGLYSWEHLSRLANAPEVEQCPVPPRD